MSIRILIAAAVLALTAESASAQFYPRYYRPVRPYFPPTNPYLNPFWNPGLLNNPYYYGFGVPYVVPQYVPVPIPTPSVSPVPPPAPATPPPPILAPGGVVDEGLRLFAPPTKNGKPAAANDIFVYAPTPDAKLSVNGVEIDGSGSSRHLSVDKIEPGSRHEYTVVATWTQNGRTRTARRVVPLDGSGHGIADFRSE